MDTKFYKDVVSKLQGMSLREKQEASQSDTFQELDQNQYGYQIDIPVDREGRIRASQPDQQASSNTLSLDHFMIGPTLGTGSYGRVKQVKLKNSTAPKNKQLYALKMLKKYEILKRNQMDHLKNEKQILSEVNNHFIIKMRATFQDSKYVYMLLDYVCGGELFGRLRKQGRFSNDVALFYITQIIIALNYLHQLGVAYRDLKPENILIDREGHVVLTDFGFAKKLPKDRTASICGTPEYLAPQIIQCSKAKNDPSKHYGKSADWWALGILLFEMVAGYPPFFDIQTNRILDKISEGIIQFPKFLSSTIKDLIRKLLNPDPSLRLGAKDCGKSIMKHRWFRGVDWELVRNRKIPAPWIPILKSEQDVCNFQKYPDSDQSARELPEEYDHKFIGF